MAIRSSFFCYCHWSSLVLPNRNGTVSFLHSGQSMNQGYSLDMVAYVTCVLHLIKEPKEVYLDITQPWYDDDAGALST